jgi:hypothetical protein
VDLLVISNDEVATVNLLRDISVSVSVSVSGSVSIAISRS